MSPNKLIQRRPRPGVPGLVVSAVPVWLKARDGSSTKHFDTRIEFDDGTGPQIAQVMLRSFEYLRPGAGVRVERSRTGRLRVSGEDESEPAAGASWRKPDIKTAVIALVVLVAIVGAVMLAALIYLQVSTRQFDRIVREQPTPTEPSPSPSSPSSLTPTPSPSSSPLTTPS